MARYTGKNLYIEFTPNGGSAVVVSTEYRTLDVDESIETADATAGNDAHKSYLPTVKDGKISIELLDTTGAIGEAIYDAFERGTEGTLVYGPEGNETGKPKWSVPVLVTSRKRSFPYNDVVTLSIELQAQDEATKSTFA